MTQGEAGGMKQLKLWMFLICFALGFDLSEGKKCCVSRAYAVCWVTPSFWENAHIAEKKISIEESIPGSGIFILNPLIQL